jgi:UDP-N-acetylmuramate dehydrogenase
VTHSLRQNVDLTPLNSFGVPARAAWYQQIDAVDDLLQARQLASRRDLPLLVLGAGSNILLRRDFPGLVLHVVRAGIARSGNEVRVGAGENWHALVKSCMNDDLHGLENLALIPGTVGAAPVQNIGAYGVELARFFKQLQAVNLATGEVETLDRDACQFAYRSSVFKRDLHTPRLILEVQLSLSPHWQPELSYAALRDALPDADPSPQQLFDTVCQIRRSKLPDPQQLGNAGSFFKNPVIKSAQYHDLQRVYPDIPAHPEASGQVKIPAAWLLDQAGWKGVRRGAAGVHERHALVLVNHGGASGEAIYQLALEMRDSVQQRFNITLEPEVRVL